MIKNCCKVKQKSASAKTKRTKNMVIYIQNLTSIKTNRNKTGILLKLC